MRPEVIAFSEGMPVKAYVRNVAGYPYHWHSAIEIIYVLQGQAYVGIGGETHLLKENNIAVVNGNELHRINKNGGDNKLLMLHLDPAFCESVNPDSRYAFFYCCSPYHEAEAAEKYNILKGHIAHLACLLSEVSCKNRNRHKAAVQKGLEELLSHMMGSFDYLCLGHGTTAFKEKQVKRFRKMYEHIKKYPKEKQGLRELAESAGVTLQHMSNDIKDKFGLTFQELLYFSKCEHAARLLLSTDEFIPGISSECGFSDKKYLIKHFKVNYHYTPSEFRKKYRADDKTLASQVQYEELPLSDTIKYIRLKVC